MSELRIKELRARAQRARDLADYCGHRDVGANLKSYAIDLDAEATKLEAETAAANIAAAPTGEPETGPEALAAMKAPGPELSEAAPEAAAESPDSNAGEMPGTS